MISCSRGDRLSQLPVGERQHNTDRQNMFDNTTVLDMVPQLVIRKSIGVLIYTVNCNRETSFTVYTENCQ